MNSAPGSASEPHPPRNTADALRPKRRRAVGVVPGRDAHRGGAANRTTRTAERDIRGIGGAHISDPLVSRDHRADAQWP